MNAIDLLIADHNRVRGLFKRFREATEKQDTNTMAELAGTIAEELDVHTTIEEEKDMFPPLRSSCEAEMLVKLAQEQEIPGRSQMSHEELAATVAPS